MPKIVLYYITEKCEVGYRVRACELKGSWFEEDTLCPYVQ